jgi:hypothetical protein
MAVSGFILERRMIIEAMVCTARKAMNSSG